MLARMISYIIVDHVTEVSNRGSRSGHPAAHVGESRSARR